jgi:hypothetical protein
VRLLVGQLFGAGSAAAERHGQKAECYSCNHI